MVGFQHLISDLYTSHPTWSIPKYIISFLTLLQKQYLHVQVTERKWVCNFICKMFQCLQYTNYTIELSV